MPYFIYQDSVNMIMRLPIGSPSVFTNAAKWEHCTLDNLILCDFKVNCSNPIT